MTLASSIRRRASAAAVISDRLSTGLIMIVHKTLVGFERQCQVVELIICCRFECVECSVLLYIQPCEEWLLSTLAQRHR
ncbi:hypothetical protein AB1N83_000801 [Pleurotus pulmonarius]